MDSDSNMPAVVKIVGIFLIFVGVIGTVTGFYALTLVKGSPAASLSVRDFSKSILDASLLVTKDTDSIKNSLEETKVELSKASGGLGDAAKDFQDASGSLEKSSENILGAADSISASAQADREAAAQLRASAEAMDLLWGPTNVAGGLRGAADKLEESASNIEATSDSLLEASLNTKSASIMLKDSSSELEGVGNDLVKTGEGISSTATSVDNLTSRLLSNLDGIVKGLEWIDRIDKKTILYEIIIYFMLIHLLFAATGIALVLVAANLYGW